MRLHRLGLRGLAFDSFCVRRGRHAKKKVHRVRSWSPPLVDVLKINTDGSSRGNPRPAGIGGAGRDSFGSVIFLFSIHKG